MARVRWSPPQPVPRVGALVRVLPDGRTMTRAADARTEVRPVDGHGQLVLRQVTFSLPDGRTWGGWEFDVTQVDPPAGAVRADPMLQSFGIGGPMLWYVDLDRVCLQCGDPFVFTGSEQRHWYETLQFDPASTAIRCPRCRKRRRTVRALHEQLALALRATEEAPRYAERWLELARVAGELRITTGQGDLDRGLAAARKAWRLSKERLPEARYWEGLFHRLAGRDDRAVEAEDAFLAARPLQKRLRALARSLEDLRAGRDR